MTSKYGALIRALQDYEDRERELEHEIGYDPCGGIERRVKEELKEAEAKLDTIFGHIVEEAMRNVHKRTLEAMQNMQDQNEREAAGG